MPGFLAAATPWLSAASTGTAIAGKIASMFSGGSSTTKSIKTQRKQQLVYDWEKAKRFPEYAKMMGVSRYALLGNTGPTASLSPVSQPSRGQRIGSAMSSMGQDVQRGIQTQMALKELESNVKLKESETMLNIARANDLNANQKPNSQSGGTVDPLIDVQPSQSIKGSPANQGVEAGGKSAQILSRDRHGYVNFDLSQALSEARESQGKAQQLVNEIRDAFMDMAETLKTNKGRERTAQLIRTEMTRTGHMNPRTEKVIYDWIMGTWRIVPKNWGASPSQRRNWKRFRPR